MEPTSNLSLITTSTRSTTAAKTAGDGSNTNPDVHGLRRGYALVYLALGRHVLVLVWRPHLLLLNQSVPKNRILVFEAKVSRGAARSQEEV